jgi:hypothetical protein
VEGQRRHTVYLRWEAEHRNQRWEADHVELPVLVLPPRARRPRTAWATLFLDAFSRLVMGWALSVTPSAATVLAALRGRGALPAPRPRQIEVFHGGRWLCTAKPQGALTAEEREQVLERRRADAAELARRQRRAARAARARLAPITSPGPVTETTVVTSAQATVERACRGGGDLRRLARTNLLGLDEIAAQTRTQAARPAAAPPGTTSPTEEG